MKLHKALLSLTLSLCSFQVFGVTHTDTRTFTFSPTSIEADNSIPHKHAADVVKQLKEHYANLIQEQVKITNIDNLWHLQKGIHVTNKDEPIFIYSRGLRGDVKSVISESFNYGQAFITIYKYIQVGLIHTPTIGFDYVDFWSNFDHGGKQRIERLNFILSELSKAEKDLILMGDCIGGKTILGLGDPDAYKNVKAIVLHAPALSFREMSENIADNKLCLDDELKDDDADNPFKQMLSNIKSGLKGAFCHTFENIFPKYDKDSDNPLEQLKHIPADIPIFLGHLYNDQFISNDEMQTLVQELRHLGHPVYFLVVDRPSVTHSRIAETEPFCKALNAFYKKYELPYDATLAQEGEEILEHALINSKSTHIEYIESAQ